MKRQHWFLPDSPDVLGQLRAQVAIAVEGVDAFARWATGDGNAAAAVADAERRSDVAKREVLTALRSALITPLEPEDVFALSRGVDRIIDSAADVITESRVLAAHPDAGVAEMARLIAAGMRQIDEAIGLLGEDGERASAAADAAIASAQALDAVYVRGMAGLLVLNERSARIGGRELYRRCSRIAELLVEVAERVIYAVVKQS